VAERLSRREFLAGAARLAALGGIGALVARLVGGPFLGRAAGGSGGSAGVRTGETCTNDGYCRSCGSFAGCGLPAALSARRRAPWARGRS
jgi:hypothetical protein